MRSIDPDDMPTLRELEAAEYASGCKPVPLSYEEWESDPRWEFLEGIEPRRCVDCSTGLASPLSNLCPECAAERVDREEPSG